MIDLTARLRFAEKHYNRMKPVELLQLARDFADVLYRPVCDPREGWGCVDPDAKVPAYVLTVVINPDGSRTETQRWITPPTA